MTAPTLTPADAIRFALAVADGAAQRPETVVLKALEIAGYVVVPAGGAGAPASVPKVPQRGPTTCQKCNKVRGNGGDLECDRTDCPF